MSKSAVLLERMVERELGVCLWLNRACRYPGVRAGFATVSWLGNGKFWYVLDTVVAARLRRIRPQGRPDHDVDRVGGHLHL